MAKIAKSVSVSKAYVTNTDGEWFLEELDKDESRLYKLSDLLRDFEGLENVSLTIKQDVMMPVSEEA